MNNHHKSCLVIIMSGPNASGKSTLSKNLQQVYEAAGKTCLVIRNDMIRLVEYPFAKHQELFPQDTKGQYIDRIAAIVAERVIKNACSKEVIILDAGFGSADYRRQAEEAAVSIGANVIGLRMVVSHKTCKQRLLLREDDISDATVENLDKQFEKDFGTYSGYWRNIDAEQDAAGMLHQAQEIIGARFPGQKI